MTGEKIKVAIIGGEIWGLSAAYHLARKGQEDVVVFERNTELAAETTKRAAGLVGQVRNSATMIQATQYAIRLFQQMAEETDCDPGFIQSGSLMLAMNEQRMAAYQQDMAFVQQHGVEAMLVDEIEIQRLAPNIDPSCLTGALFIPTDGYLDPYRCAMAYANQAEKLGVKIRLNQAVDDLAVSSDGVVTGLQTSDGLIEAERVVVTIGPWSRRLMRKLGIQSAVETIRHQRMVTESVPVPDHHPVVRIKDLSGYVRRDGNRYLYGYFEPNPTTFDPSQLSPDFGTDDLPPPEKAMQMAKTNFAQVFPILKDLRIDEYQQGLVGFSPDGQYLLGPVPSMTNLYLACGCAALGIVGSAAIGHWVTEWLMDSTPKADLSMFDHSRFGVDGENLDWVRQQAISHYANYYALPN